MSDGKDIVDELREYAVQLSAIVPDRVLLATRAADTITTLREQVERLTEERKARHPRQFKYAPTPWSYEGNSDDGYYLLDANGQKIVMLLWPIHPVEETEAVEAEAPLIADFLAFQSAWLTATTLDFFDMERRAAKAEAERDAAIARAEKAEAALTNAASDVLAERKRQVSVEGLSIEHDDEHDRGEIARAAAAYALAASYSDFFRMKNRVVDKLHEQYVDGGPTRLRHIWPWDWEWWKPKDRRHDLVRAGALILAEIERLDRAALASLTEGE